MVSKLSPDSWLGDDSGMRLLLVITTPACTSVRVSSRRGVSGSRSVLSSQQQWGAGLLHPTPYL